MKVFVNRDRCIGCGICTMTAPAVFHLGEDEKSHPLETRIPEGSLENAESARQRCPASAIALEK